MPFAQSSSLKNHAASSMEFRSADTVIKFVQKVNVQPASGKLLSDAA